jgi:hypothetical protein
MIGKLVKEENNWFIKYFDIWVGVKYVELHPDDVKQIEEDSYHFDNIEARIAAYPDMEFELIEKPNLIYAKLTPNEPVDEHGYPIYGTFGRDRVNKTIEEAAERLYPINNTGDMFMPNREQINNSYRQEGFIEGAKCQAERMYSEEDLREAYFSAIKSTGDGWNGEYADGNDPDIKEIFTRGFDKWFENYKKK